MEFGGSVFLALESMKLGEDGMLDNFREWLSDNLRYVLLGLAVVLVIIIGFCIFRLIGGSSSKKSDTGTTKPTAASSDEQSSTESVSAVSISAPEAGEGLTMNEKPHLELATKYYNAVTAEDEQTLATIVEPWNDTVKEDAFALNDKFKSFDNITTYSKDGPVDDSWLVYVYCECQEDEDKKGIPTLLNPLLVITTDSSDLKISSDRGDYADFINESNASEGVQQLIDEVNRQYEELKGTDSRLQDNSSDSSGSSGNQETTEAAGADSSSTTTNGTATATANVNIRSEGSTNGAVLATLYPGQEVSIVSKEGDWTHVIFTDSTGNKIDGYVSSEYLNFS